MLNFNDVATEVAALQSSLGGMFIPLNSCMQGILESTGIQVVTLFQLRLMVCIILGIPLGFVLPRLTSSASREIFSLFIGLTSSLFVFQEKILFIHVHSIVVYLICIICGRHSNKVVFASSFLLLAMQHFIRLTDNAMQQRDISVGLIMMGNFCRYVCFASCYADGQELNRALTLKNRETARPPSNEYSSDQQNHALRTLPSFIRYFTYMNFMTTTLAGPLFEFTLFTAYIDKQQQVSDKIFSAVIHEVWKNLLIGGAYLSIAVFVQPYLPMEYLATAAFGSLFYYQKIGLILVIVALQRVRYYSIWRLLQATLCATGITYRVKEGDFNGVLSIDESLEFDCDLRAVITKWNCTSQTWLSRYIYSRIYSERELAQNRGNAKRAQLVTFLFSAFWHGFYPGYLFAFTAWFALLQVQKQLHTVQKKAVINNKLIRRVVAIVQWIVFWFAVDCLGAPFVLLSFSSSWAFFQNILFIPHVILVLLFLTLQLIETKRTSLKGD